MMSPHTVCSRLSPRRFLLALAMSALPAVAAAQAPVDPAAKAQAEALFAEGTALLDEGEAAAACPKLEAAVTLTGGEALGGKLMLGRCYEATGRRASAWALYNEVAALAAAAGQTARASEARAAADAVAPSLHRVAIILAPADAARRDLSVVLGNRPLARAAWSSAFPIDPGTIEIAVEAPGMSPQNQTLTIPDEPGETRVEVPALAPAPADAPPPGVPAPTSPSPPGASASFWSGERIAGLILGITGAAGVAVGGGLGALAVSEYDDGLVEGGCAGSPPVCRDTAFIDDARALGDAATGVFFAGAGAFVVGVIVFAAAPNARAPVPARAGLTAGAGYARVDLTVALD